MGPKTEDGRYVSLLGNIDAGNARLTKHVLTLSVFEHARWFTLARYHDVDVTRSGPNARAAFLALPTDAWRSRPSVLVCCRWAVGWEVPSRTTTRSASSLKSATTGGN